MSLAGILATVFAAGRFPVAPGTAGSAVALPLGWLIVWWGGWPVLVAAIVAVTVVGIWASGRYADETGMEDPGSVVIDEVAGQWIALLPISLLTAPLAPLPYLLAFVAFRFFDIVKPWPVSWADQRLPGGLGIMADDLLAGIYAAAAVLLFLEGWTRWTTS